MGIFNFLSNLFGSGGADSCAAGGDGLDSSAGCDINPANGLPMMDGVFDVAGNVFGSDDDMFSSSSIHSDSMFD